MHEGTEHLYEELQDIDLVIVIFGDLHALLDESFLDEVFVEGEGSYVVSRGVVGEDACGSQQICDEGLVSTIRALGCRFHEERHQGHERTDVYHLYPKIFVETGLGQ